MRPSSGTETFFGGMEPCGQDASIITHGVVALRWTKSFSRLSILNEKVYLCVRLNKEAGKRPGFDRKFGINIDVFTNV